MAAPVQQRTLLMHQIMLGDRVRLEAYDEALRRSVRPGDVVADVGAGTLVLSMMALRHGAEPRGIDASAGTTSAFEILDEAVLHIVDR